jgi:uncharacterized protein (DUF2267 family)
LQQGRNRTECVQQIVWGCASRLSLRDRHVLREETGGRVKANLADECREQIAESWESVAERKETASRRFFKRLNNGVSLESAWRMISMKSRASYNSSQN